jgi:hypothetical protein
LRTSIPRNPPFTRPFKRVAAAAKLIVTVQAWDGPLSKGSATPFSHGSGADPRNTFSTFSVIPPELAKKYVVAGVSP